MCLIIRVVYKAKLDWGTAHGASESLRALLVFPDIETCVKLVRFVLSEDHLSEFRGKISLDCANDRLCAVRLVVNQRHLVNDLPRAALRGRGLSIGVDWRRQVYVTTSCYVTEEAAVAELI